jgi:Ca2+-binding EF-hand superfamily protein
MSTQSSHPHGRRFVLRRMPLSMVAAMVFSAALPLTPALANTAATEAGAVFKRTDANSDGKLSKEECQNLPAIAARFDEFDKDKDGFLTLEEFMAAMAAPPK